jgi:DNA helicase INO80
VPLTRAGLLSSPQEREAAAALRRQEEMREAKRQQQRLNFLLTQTELYSHFMRNQGIPQAGQPALERSPSVGTSPEDAEENARLQEEAAQAAQAAAARTQDRTRWV